MSDTNWCTFCDCAVSPFSNSIYCSEDCFRRDALAHHPLLKLYVEQQQKQQRQPTVTSMPEYTPSRRESNTSLCSEDLAAMHMDMIPSTTQQQTVPTAPMLSTSISPASSHNEPMLRTPPLSYSYHPAAISEKLSSYYHKGTVLQQRL